MGFYVLKKVPVHNNKHLKALNLNEIKDALKSVPKWSHTATFIERDFVFNNFNEALKFLNHVAELTEQQQHHPIFIYNYNKLKIQMNTHDVQGISHKDFDLARAIDQLAL